MNNIKALSEAIERLHGSKCEHVETVAVDESHEGQTIWKGFVEVFRLKNNPKSDTCYAWQFENDKGEIEHIAVLGADPIKDARMAVQAYLVSLSK